MLRVRQRTRRLARQLARIQPARRLARMQPARRRARGPIAALPAQRKRGGVRVGAASAAAPGASATCANAATGESPSASTADRRTFAVLRKTGACLFIGHLFQETSLIPHHAVYRPTLSYFGCSRKIGTRVQPRPPILSRMSYLADKLPHLLSTIHARAPAPPQRTNDPQTRDEPSEEAASFTALCGPARPNEPYEAPGGKGRAELRRFG